MVADTAAGVQYFLTSARSRLINCETDVGTASLTTLTVT